MTSDEILRRLAAHPEALEAYRVSPNAAIKVLVGEVERLKEDLEAEDDYRAAQEALREPGKISLAALRNLDNDLVAG
jgi:uncharacterized small protein (DUF1192 family)